MTLLIGTSAFLAVFLGFPWWGLLLLSVACYRVVAHGVRHGR
jgi:hypothetical protein